MSKEVLIEGIKSIQREVWELFWKWGGYLILLLFTVSSRIFYQIQKDGKFNLFKLFAIAGLSFSVGIVALILCIKNGATIMGVIFMILCVLLAYRIIDYVVNIDIKDSIIDFFMDYLKKIRGK